MAAANAHKSFALEADQLLTQYQQQWQTNNALVGGTAFETGKTKLTELAKELFTEFAKNQQLSQHLTAIAEAQRDLERFYDHIASVAQMLGIRITGFVVVSAVGPLGPVAAVIQLQLLMLKQFGEALDLACATAIRSLGQPRPLDPSTSVLLDGHENLNLDELHETALSMAKSQDELMKILQAHPDARLLEAGQGQFAIMFGAEATQDTNGAPTTASALNPEVITTMISGKGSGDPHTWAGDAERAANMARYTGQPVVYWAGYDPPDTYIEAMNPEFAEVGAVQLQKFLQETSERFPDAKQLVIAHSYGSTTAGLAAQLEGGLAADTMILVASPGVHADRVDQLQLKSPDSKVVVVTNEDDLIPAGYPFHGGIFDDFGAERWELPGGHSSAFSDDTFITNIQQEVNRLSQN